MTKISMLKSALALALMAGAAGSAAAQQPQVDVLGQRPDPDALSVRVGFSDLDLTSKGDQARLTTRVRGAVTQVCAPFRQAGERLDHAECRSVAWKGAKPQLENAFARAQLAAKGGAQDTAVAAITVSAPKL